MVGRMSDWKEELGRAVGPSTPAPPQQKTFRIASLRPVSIVGRPTFQNSLTQPEGVDW
jgi:hypothetical protein